MCSDVRIIASSSSNLRKERRYVLKYQTIPSNKQKKFNVWLAAVRKGGAEKLRA